MNYYGYCHMKFGTSFSTQFDFPNIILYKNVKFIYKFEKC